MSTTSNNVELSPTKQLKENVAKSLRASASKFQGLNQSLHNEQSEVGDDETEEYQVLQSALVVDDIPNPVACDGNIVGADPKEVAAEKAEAPWNSRTSFTADSPYFDAFVTSEMESFNVLADTLNGIASHTRAFVKQGALMSDVAKRLSMACKLRSPDHFSDDESDNDPEENAEDDLIRQRRNAVGEEMAGVLELLGEVRNQFFLRTWLSFSLSHGICHLRFSKRLLLRNLQCAKHWKRPLVCRWKRLLRQNRKPCPFCSVKQWRALDRRSKCLQSMLADG